MGVVFRATQLALRRPVALKAIAPDLAADSEYRERFQRESHLAAMIDHPNVIPVYEAGELDGTLYLIMRWIDGTDLEELFRRSGRLSPRRAITLLRPVASALAAAHRHGLVHRDIKPANVLIARGYEQGEDHIYLTDFGIARHTDTGTSTRTGAFVGTIDYMAPERIEGNRGDAPSDIYSFGCMLFEALAGRVPFDRPTDISRIFAHINDPIPSIRDHVDGVPELLDEIIVKSMAKRPEDRFGSAVELTAALGRVLRQLDTAERTIVSPAPEDGVPPGATTIAAVPPTLAPEQAATLSMPPAPALDQPAPAAPVAERSAPANEPPGAPAGTSAMTPGPTSRMPDRPPGAPRSRRSPILWIAPIAVLVVAAVPIVLLTNGGHSATGAKVEINGGGLTEGRTVTVSGQPGSISLGTRNLWVSLPEQNELVRSSLNTGDQQTFPATGHPTAIAAGTAALWVAQPGSHELAQFNGDSGAQLYAAKLSGTPVAVALAQRSSAWVADSSGAITHVALGGQVVGTPAHSAPLATGLDVGEGWVWGANGADKGLVRVDSGTSGSSAAFAAGPSPIAVALNQGVWTASANGTLTRFDPRTGQLRVNAQIPVAATLDAVAATDQGSYVWALSKKTKTLYRVSATGNPTVTGTVAFGSTPVALAVNTSSVWVALQNGEAIQIRFS
jgi:serine/threonine protein kinase